METLGAVGQRSLAGDLGGDKDCRVSGRCLTVLVDGQDIVLGDRK